MTQSSFASSQVAWQPDRQSNVLWRSIYINATAFKDYQTNVLPRKHDFTHTTNSLLLDQLCPASLQAQRLPKKLRSMKAKKQLLLSTNSFLTHPAILRYCFQGKTLLSLPIEMTEWKNLPINLVWGRELFQLNINTWSIATSWNRNPEIFRSTFLKCDGGFTFQQHC